MNRSTTSIAVTLALGSLAVAQGPDFLVTYSQSENNLSTSGGTVLGGIRPNEIAHLEYSSGACPASAEKWLVRSATHTMAGDENGDGFYWNPAIFNRIDALLAVSAAVGTAFPDNQRTVYWSVSNAMGNNVSTTPFRPGDVARIVRNGALDGQVQHFMRQEQFNQALGLPLANPIDVDAIAFGPNFGVYFSIDVDQLCNTACGPMLVRDGDVLCIPPWALTYTADLRIAGVAANSAIVVHGEAQMDAFTVNANVADRNGACLGTVLDVEALEIDLFGPVTSVIPCPGWVLTVPTLIYSCETGTGASLLTTQGGGQIYNTPCGPAGTPCGFGPTMGPQLGLRPPTAAQGVASHVNGLTFTRTCRHVLEPQQPVMNVFPGGAPAGANAIDYGQPFPVSLVLIEIAPAVVPPSLPAFPFSQNCFPDLYALSITPHLPVFGPWGSFPMVAIPPLWTGKVIFQSVGFSTLGTFELSTPCVVDVN